MQHQLAAVWAFDVGLWRWSGRLRVFQIVSDGAEQKAYQRAEKHRRQKPAETPQTLRRSIKTTGYRGEEPENKYIHCDDSLVFIKFNLTVFDQTFQSLSIFVKCGLVNFLYPPFGGYENYFLYATFVFLEGNKVAKADRKLTTGGGVNLVNQSRVFSCGSAMASVHWPRHHVAVARYSGLVCSRCLIPLRREVIEYTRTARVLVLDYSRAAFAMSEFSAALKSDGVTDAPAALIVQPEQFAWAGVYCDKMADLGIVRVRFLPWENERVCLWVDSLTGDRALREYLPPVYKSLTAVVDL